MPSKKKPVSEKDNVKIDFEKRCKLLKMLGVTFNQEYEYRGEGEDRKSHDVAVFKNVSLPLTAHEWVALCRNEGQFYMGGCCGSLSAIQDKVESFFRFESGWLSIRDLADVAEGMIHHNGDCGDDDSCSSFHRLPKKETIEKAAKRWATSLKKFKNQRLLGKKLIDPWEFLALVWHITKDFYSPTVPHPPASVVNPEQTKLDDAVSLLSRALLIISWDGLIKRDPALEEPEEQKQANRLALLARMLPALKMLNDHINELAPPPFEGIALVHKDSPNDIMETLRGLCIFGKEEDAQNLIKLWTQSNNQYEGEGKNYNLPKPEEFLIRKVRITKDEGATLLTE